MSISTGSAWVDGSSSLMKRYKILRGTNWGKAAVVGVPAIWLAVFFFVPFLVVFKISLSETCHRRASIYLSAGVGCGRGVHDLQVEFG